MKKNKIPTCAILLGMLASCSKPVSLSVSYYVGDVGSTLPILLSGLYEGEKIDYVISSYPTILTAMNNQEKTTELSIVEDVRESFEKKYNTKGFPQAGLFIKTELANDATKKDQIESFLSDFDEDMSNLVNHPEKSIEQLRAYSTDPEIVKNKFGIVESDLSACLEKNRFAYIEEKKNPSIEDFSAFEGPLGLTIDASMFSSYYGAPSLSWTSYSFTYASPLLAPSFSLLRHASEDSFVTQSAALMKAEFTKGEKDFLLFDSVNGMNLSKKNGSTYQLVRMVTFGNLYVVSTGNDVDHKLSEEDTVLGYGENLIPDLAFKAVHE